jgi:DNA-binding transcriptional regulator GbsR (MarR family)
MRTRKNLQQTQDELEKALSSASESLDQDLRNEINTALTLKKKCDLVLKQLKSTPESKEVYKNIKQLKRDLNMVFEWHDGILVEAM